MRRGRFRRVLTQDLERAFSWRFAISVLAIVLLMMLDNLEYAHTGRIYVFALISLLTFCTFQTF